MNKKPLIYLMIFLIMTTLSASGSQTAEDKLKMDMVNSAKNLNSYNFSLESSQNIIITNPSANNTSIVIITSFGKGSVNLTGKEMSVISTINASSNSSKNATPVQAETYFINDTIYSKADNNWTRLLMPNSSELWNQQNMVKQQAEMLNDSNIVSAGLDTVNGQNCYKIKVIPNETVYAAILSQQMGSSLPLADMNLTELFKNSTMEWTSWITRDTNHLAKNDIKMAFTITPEIIGLSPVVANFEMKVNLQAKMLFRDFDKPMNITLPDNATNAPTLTLIESNTTSVINESKKEVINETKAAAEAGSSTNLTAFPLTGGNGAITATVFGVKYSDHTSISPNPSPETKTLVTIDMACDLPWFNAVLVDNDDNFYNTEYSISYMTNIAGVPKEGPSKISSGHNQRNLLSFIIPKGATIKRLRIEPRASSSPDPNPEYPDPFVVDWKDTPDITIKFYSVNKSLGDPTNPNEVGKMFWDFALKITNNRTQNLQLKYSDLVFEDQYGWQYTGSVDKYGGDKETVLLPGESIKTIVKVSGVSPFSRLVNLLYKGWSLDISAWT